MCSAAVAGKKKTRDIQKASKKENQCRGESMPVPNSLHKGFPHGAPFGHVFLACLNAVIIGFGRCRSIPSVLVECSNSRMKTVD